MVKFFSDTLHLKLFIFTLSIVMTGQPLEATSLRYRFRLCTLGSETEIIIAWPLLKVRGYNR